MAAINRWLASPVFEGDEEKTRQASVVNMIGLVCIAFILIVMAGALLGKNTSSTTLLLDLFGSAMILQFLLWLRRGRVTLARTGIVIFGFIFIAAVTASIGTIRTPTASIFVFWIVMTSALFGKRGILAGTVAASLAVWGLIAAENSGWLSKPTYEVGVTQWVTFTALLGFTGGLTYYIIQGTQKALAIAKREIEERKRLDASFQESEQRYRTLVEWTPEPIAVHRHGIVLYVNPAAITMFGADSASDLIGHSMLERVHPDFRHMVESRARSAAQHGSNTPKMEEKLLKMDGTVIDVEVQGTTINFDGAPALHISMSDITKRKAIDAALQAAHLQVKEASKAKSQFLASASHDLRQPTHALGMFVARLASLPHDTQTSHLVDCLDASVHALQNMLDGYLDMSQLDAENNHCDRFAFPVERLFGPLRSALDEAASGKDLRLKFRPSNAWVESDPHLLNRILLNLVGNAIRYTAQGSVLVACRPTHDGTRLRIEVRDSGIGIAPEHHEAIFQEFFQVANAQRDRRKGLGVGLSIVDRACRLLEHPLTLRSAPGRGTTFTVTVPLGSMRTSEVSEHARELTALTHFGGLCVMLIEDDELGRVALSTLLTSWGCSVMVAEGAQRAFELCRIEKIPDFIISDYRLGDGINGVETLNRLNAIAGRKIAACLISGDTAESVRQQALDGGFPLLQKPVRPAKLRNLIRHLTQASSVQ